MKTKKILSQILAWFPSIIIVLFFIPNALSKILYPSKMEKIVTNNIVIIIAGMYLLIAIILFLNNKTILTGTFLLTLYMTFIVLIHMYKGKPYEIAILIVMSTIFASYVRKPKLFSSSTESLKG